MHTDPKFDGRIRLESIRKMRHNSESTFTAQFRTLLMNGKKLNDNPDDS